MKRIISILLLCLLLGLGTAHAQDFWVGSVFNDTLGTKVPNVMGFDWSSSGSGNAQGVGPVGTPIAVGTTFDFRYQSYLFALTDPTGSTVAFPGLNTNFEYTVVAQIPEVVISFTPLARGASIANFQTLDGGKFFIYHDAPANANVAAGTGFDNGTLVASGTIDLGQISTFTAISPSQGIGSTILQGKVTYANPAFIDPTIDIIGFRFEGSMNYPPLDSTTSGFFDNNAFPRYVVGSNDLTLKVDGSNKFTIQPCIEIKKQISVDGGTTWLDADTQATAALTTTPHGALYRLIVKNCGTIDLSNITIKDPTLNINYNVGNLAAGASITLTSLQIPELNQPQRCQTPGPYENVATVTGNDTSGNQVTASNAAWLVCTPMPCIDLKKQLSVDGGTIWLDADTQATAAIALAPHGAIYRLIVTNCGPTDLVNLVVNDAVIGITDFSIGNLSVGASVTITSAQIPALDQPQRCLTPGPYENVATVSGKDTNGVTVSASNAAWLVCTPVPCIDIKKQISVDNGTTWLDADTQVTAALAAAPHGAIYRLIISNCGTADLTGVTINDPTLGIKDYVVGALPAGASSVTLTAAEIPVLNQPQRCQTPGTYENVATVTGKDSRGNQVTASNAAWLVCTPTPCIKLLKQISIDGGSTWLNADTQAAAAKVTAPHSALYRLIVTNCGNIDLINVTINDPTLGINYVVGSLAIAASVTLTSAEIQALNQPQRCQTPGPYENIATVTGNDANGTKVSASDPAWLVCTAPPCIDIKKQISIDNGTTWLDADTQATAATATAPHGAIYRLIVSNCGTVELTNVTINDPTLSISNYLVGNLAIGASLTLTAAEIPALNQPVRCQTPGPYENIATATGKDANGVTVNASNPAWLICTQPPPPPCITIKKQISVNCINKSGEDDKVEHCRKDESKDNYCKSHSDCEYCKGHEPKEEFCKSEMCVPVWLDADTPETAAILARNSEVCDSKDQEEHCKGNESKDEYCKSHSDCSYCKGNYFKEDFCKRSHDSGEHHDGEDDHDGEDNHRGKPGVMYRLIVNNCGTVDLTNVTVNDPTLGITSYLVGNLAASASVTLTSAQIPQLLQPNRCCTPGLFLNTACAKGTADSTSVEQCDPAYLLCKAPLSCRVTAGGNKDGITSPCTLKKDGLPDSETCVEEGRDTWGGQAGAQPRIDGNWTHHHKPSSDKSFVFHSNRVFSIGCSDPGCCKTCANADNRQIDFAGVGRFNNQKGFSFPKGDLCYSVHLEDLGEPGRGGRWPSATEPCTHCTGTPIKEGDCVNCTDYYEIKVYDNAAHDNAGHCTGKMIYTNGPGTPELCTGPNDPHLLGYFIRAGNVQMHRDNNGP